MGDENTRATDPDQGVTDESVETDEAEKLELRRQLALEVEEFEGGIQG